MICFTPSLVRLAAPVAAVVMSAAALTACGSSSTSADSTSSPSTSSMAPSDSTAPSASGIDPSIAALCTGLNAADLASLSQAKDPTSEEQAWAKLAADAPDAIKGDMQTIDTYLKAAIARDYATLQSAAGNLSAAVTHIEAYITANCHS